MIHWRIDFLVGALLLLVSGSFFAVAMTYPRLAAIYPIFVSIVLMALSALLMRSAVARRRSDELHRLIEHNLTIVCKLIAGIIVYILVVSWLGYILSTFLLIVYTILSLGYTQARRVILVSGLTVFLLLVVFEYLIGVPLPTVGLLDLFSS